MKPAAAAAGLALALLAAGPARPGDVDVAAVELHDALPQGPSVEERLVEIQRQIREALVYPASARRRGLTGTSRVRFEVGADGRAHGVELARSSGHAILDRAATRGVERADALPYVYGLLEIPVEFRLVGR
jgi:TonB family protein